MKLKYPVSSAQFSSSELWDTTFDDCEAIVEGEVAIESSSEVVREALGCLGQDLVGVPDGPCMEYNYLLLYILNGSVLHVVSRGSDLEYTRIDPKTKRK